MSIRWNGDDAKLQIGEAMASGLLRAAVFFQTQHQLRMNVSNPRPYLNSSKPGEYLRARTGFARDSVAYEPTSIAAILAEQSVRIGYRKNAFYAPWWEVYGGRKGLIDTMHDLKPQLAKIITGS